jgi:hypothetical protein
MSDCNNYNQYYTDVVIDGKIVNERCFKGSKVYSNIKDYKFNSPSKYKSEEYYSWINREFQKYAFPPEKFNEDTYNPEIMYQSICNAKDYSLKPQQKFAARVINTHTNNRGLLIYHGLGSGKTQTSIIIGEAFKFRRTDDFIINDRAATHVLIVVPKALKDQYYSEIIGKIENGQIKSATGEVLINEERQFYLDEDLRDAISQAYTDIMRLEREIMNGEGNAEENVRQITLLKNSIRLREKEERSKVNKVYYILTHEKFLNEVFKYKPDTKEFTPGEYIKLLKFKNGLLIIDEIQGLVSAIGSSYRKLLYAIKFYANPEFRVVALTGTPIYDKPFEFGLLMNLLRPRIEFPDGIDEFNETFIENKNKIKNRDLFKMMCSGYISYFKGGNPEAYPFKKTVLMLHSMDPFQYTAYKQAVTDEVGRELEKGIRAPENESFIVRVHNTERANDEASTGIYNNSNLCCNIAFPEAQLTTIEAKHITRKTRLEANIRKFRELLREEVRLSNHLMEPQKTNRLLGVIKNYSSKFAKVAELIMQSKGPVFVYSNFVYYGVDAMAIVMNTFGYTEFPDNSGRGMYFIWKGQADENEIVKAKELFNSKANVNGDILRIMFGTQTTMEGVDFRNVRQVHILDPWWNDSRVQQIVARGIRLCSHRDLPANERYVDVFIHLSTLGSKQKLYEVTVSKVDERGNTYEDKIKSLLVIENPDESRPGYWVYRESYIVPNTGEVRESSRTFLASSIVRFQKMGDPELINAFGGYKDLDKKSVQEYMYDIAVRKLTLNRQFERAIKEVSIDCSLNKNGNIVRLDEFYSPTADENFYTLQYENYSTGETYKRLGVPDIFTLQDIVDNIALRSTNYKFVSKDLKEVTLNKSLIISERINCSQPNYSFNKVPEKIINETLNHQVIPQLMNLNLGQIKDYFNGVQRGTIDTVDPKLSEKINLFKKQDINFQKDELIKKLLDRGVGDDASAWQLYTLAELKKIFKSLN